MSHEQTPPQKELFELCRSKVGNSVWAIAAGMTEKGEFQWEVFVETKKNLKKIPKKFRGEKVIGVLAPRPTVV